MSEERTEDRIGTHWEGCYEAYGHHECALAEIDRLREREEVLRGHLKRLLGLYPRKPNAHPGYPAYKAHMARVETIESARQAMKGDGGAE